MVIVRVEWKKKSITVGGLGGGGGTRALATPSLE